MNKSRKRLQLYELLDLDSKVDYLDLLGTDEERENLWSRFDKEKTPKDREFAESQI